MKTTEEKIAVMHHYANGGRVECTTNFSNDGPWRDVAEPIWNWKEWDYRIKEEKPKMETVKLYGQLSPAGILIAVRRFRKAGLASHQKIRL